jgi:predicted lipoprotein
VEDSKLKPVYGGSAEEAKPASAEFWRSGRSARTIELNLASIRDLTRAMIGGAEGADTAAETADAAASIAGSMQADIGPSAQDEKARRRIQILMTAVSSARQTASTVLPAALGVTLGFNSLDGD